MSYLLDTNVVSEFIKLKPNERVVRWMDFISKHKAYLSVLSFGEMRKGIEDMRDGARKNELRGWLDYTLPQQFEGRILPVDQAIAECWGRIMSSAKKTLPIVDSLIAATAMHHDFALVTRNTKDFNIPTLEVINPWL